MKLNVLATNLRKIEAYLDKQEAQLVEAADKKRVQEMLKKAKEKLKKFEKQLRNHTNTSITKIPKGSEEELHHRAKHYYLFDTIVEQKALIKKYEKQLKTAK